MMIEYYEKMCFIVISQLNKISAIITVIISTHVCICSTSAVLKSLENGEYQNRNWGIKRVKIIFVENFLHILTHSTSAQVAHGATDAFCINSSHLYSLLCLYASASNIQFYSQHSYYSSRAHYSVSVCHFPSLRTVGYHTQMRVTV